MNSLIPDTRYVRDRETFNLKLVGKNTLFPAYCEKPNKFI